MNLIARNLPPAADANDDMNATIDHRANPIAQTVTFEQPGLGPDDRPMGSSEMPTPKPQPQSRYTYGSGARPLDGYTIKRAIGRGGFGEVYYATSDAGKETAIKLILRNLDVESRGVKQCMNLKSPNLLSIYDLRTTDAGESFVVMEYVQGRSLRELLDERHQLSWAEAQPIACQVAEALRVAHAAGVVHRDIKPANILIARAPGQDPLVKLADFGIARADDLTRLTGTATSLGTPLYMAPDAEPSPKMDFYALGCVLFEMLAGRPPFDSETAASLFMQHERERPDLTLLPPEAQGPVARLLQKDPARRPADAAAVLELLSGSGASPSRGTRALPGGRRTLLFAAAALGVIVVAALVAVAAMRTGDDGPTAAAQGQHEAVGAAVAPDGPTQIAGSAATPSTTPPNTPITPGRSPDTPHISKVNSSPRLKWGDTEEITIKFSAPQGDASTVQLHEEGHNSDGTPLRWGSFQGADGKLVDWTGDGYIRRPLTASKDDQRNGEATYFVKFPCSEGRTFQSQISLVLIRETPAGSEYSEISQFTWTCSKTGD